MKKSPTNFAFLFAVLLALLAGGCATEDSIRSTKLPTARPIALYDVGGATDQQAGTLVSTPALDEWQAKNHADIIGEPTPIIEHSLLTGWMVRWTPNPNPYLLHLAYAKVGAEFSLVNGISTQDVLNKLWEWRSATLGFPGRPVYLNYTASAMNLQTYSLGGATDNRDVLNKTALRSDMDQESRVSGFWYLYHDPAYTIELGALHLTVPPGYPTASAYLEHRRQLEAEIAPPLKLETGRVEFAAKIPVATDQALLMDRMVVRSDWLDVQPFSRLAGGPVALVKIVSVKPGTPLEKEGVNAGAILVSYQHIKLAGLSEGEFRQLMKTPLTSDVRLEIAETAQDRHPREIVIPLAALLHQPAPPTDAAK